MPVETEPAAAPAQCPFCRSTAITTTGKRTASTYWRCEACGQLWHPDRIQFLQGRIRPRF